MQTNFDQDLLDGMRVNPNYDEPILNQVIRIAIYDEFHAYETYAKVIERFGEVQPFSSILISEQRHFTALTNMATKYNVPLPINNWADKITIPSTLVECCEVGVAAEIDNVAMYDDLIKYTTAYPYLLDVLFRLQAASFNNHLPAFRKCVAQYSNHTKANEEIYNDFSEHKIDDTMAKINQFGELANKLSTGQVSQAEMMQLLGGTNMSFIAGALLGAVGTSIFAQMAKKENLEPKEEV